MKQNVNQIKKVNKKDTVGIGQNNTQKNRIIAHFCKNIWLFTKKVVILRSILNFQKTIENDK